MLLNCTSEEISSFRNVLLSVYDGATKDTYDDSDKDALKDLLGRLEKITPEKSNWDKIQWLQIDYLKSNISEFIEKIW